MVIAASKGFTLIEIVVVITILGILAAVAIPRYVSLQREAADGTVRAVAGAITSGTALNYGQYLAAGNVGTQVNNSFACSALSGFLDGGLDAGLSLVGANLTGCGTGGAVDVACRLQHTQGTAGGFPVQAVCTN